MRNSVFQLLSECIDLRLKPITEQEKQRYKILTLASHRYSLLFERRGVSVSRLDNGVDFYQTLSNKKLQNTPLDLLDQPLNPQPPIVVDTYASEGLVQFFLKMLVKVLISMY